MRIIVDRCHSVRRYLLPRGHYIKVLLHGLFTLDDTENDTDTETNNDNYGFQCNVQSISHCTETLSLMPLANFSHFICLTTFIVLGVAQCEHTITTYTLQIYYQSFEEHNILRYL